MTRRPRPELHAQARARPGAGPWHELDESGSIWIVAAACVIAALFALLLRFLLP